MLEFSFKSESLTSDLDSRFKTHSLTPSDDVLVKAMFFWFGDQLILAIFGLEGIPIMGSVAAGGLVETFSDINENLDLELLGSSDSNGDWKSQLQLFYRY